MTRQPEGKLVKKAKAYLEKRDAAVFNIHGDPDNPFQEVGIPDLLVCWKGHFLGLEFKQKGEKPSLRQQFNLAKIEAAGGYGRVITTLEEVIGLLGEIERTGG